MSFLNNNNKLIESENDIGILKKIKSLVWVDKSYDYFVDNNVKYFKYYASLLNKYE